MVRGASELDKPVSELELSVRAMRILRDAHIDTVRELVTKTENELLEYSFGRKPINEIKDILTAMGLSLAG